ncbi:MAG: hypothetical protein SPJ51_01315 [Candidatus Enterosoma sp.]|nr:hypothetical protein [bacterium]MDY5909442.1 hypothetical protein [Candidatus Enterosoma sp.]
MRKAVLKKVGSMFSTSIKGTEATYLILKVVQTARLNGLCPDRWAKCLLENYGELSDSRTAQKNLPWSKSLPDSLRFTKAETEQLKEVVEKNLKTSLACSRKTEIVLSYGFLQGGLTLTII